MSFIQTLEYNKNKGAGSATTYGGNPVESGGSNNTMYPADSSGQPPVDTNTVDPSGVFQKPKAAGIDLSKGISDFKGPGKDKKVGVFGNITSGGIDGLAQKIGDRDPTTNTKKESAVTIGSSFLKGAGIGAATGSLAMGIGAIPGAIIGGTTGLITGIFKNKKAKAKAAKYKTKKLFKERQFSQQSSMNDILNRAPATSATIPNNNQNNDMQFGYTKDKFKPMVFNTGGVLFNSSFYNIKKLAKAHLTGPLLFQKGGILAATANIIPNGVLHSEKNKLGDKGMPVVKCDLDKKECTKKYEIEKEELILTLANTKKIEELSKGGRVKELGDFLVTELLDNTHSFSKKFNYLNKLSS